RPQLGHEMVKRRVDASERYRVYRAVAVLINIKAPGSSFDFAIPHQLVNDVTCVPKSVIVVPEADAALIFDVATTVQYLESVSRHAQSLRNIIYVFIGSLQSKYALIAPFQTSPKCPSLFLSFASALDHDVQVQRQSRAGAKHAGYRLERAVRHARDELWGASDSCASMGGCRLWAISPLSA